MMTKRKTFSKEFKLEAVRLLELGDKFLNDIATDLGMRRNINGGQFLDITLIA